MTRKASLGDVTKLIGAIADSLPSYDSRKVARDEVNGVEVSTVFTTDQGYETAIIDAVGAHPVERYPSREASVEGHAKWLKQATTLTKVTELGWNDVVPDKVITLKRKEVGQ